MSNKTTLKSLLYKHTEYHQHKLEGIQDHEQIQQAYSAHAVFCVIAEITHTHVCIKLPSISDGLPVARYEDHKINTGLWLAFSDYETDIDSFYWCRNWLTAQLRRLLCKAKAAGPYLLHIVQI